MNAEFPHRAKCTFCDAPASGRTEWGRPPSSALTCGTHAGKIFRRSYDAECYFYWQNLGADTVPTHEMQGRA